MRLFRFSAVMDWRVPRCGWAPRSGPAWASSSPTSTSGRPNLVTRGFVLTPTAVVSRLDQYFPQYFSWKLPLRTHASRKNCVFWWSDDWWLKSDCLKIITFGRARVNVLNYWMIYRLWWYLIPAPWPLDNIVWLHSVEILHRPNLNATTKIIPGLKHQAWALAF